MSFVVVRNADFDPHHPHSLLPDRESAKVRPTTPGLYLSASVTKTDPQDPVPSYNSLLTESSIFFLLQKMSY